MFPFSDEAPPSQARALPGEITRWPARQGTGQVCQQRPGFGEGAGQPARRPAAGGGRRPAARPPHRPTVSSPRTPGRPPPWPDRQDRPRPGQRERRAGRDRREPARGARPPPSPPHRDRNAGPERAPPLAEHQQQQYSRPTCTHPDHAPVSHDGTRRPIRADGATVSPQGGATRTTPGIGATGSGLSSRFPRSCRPRCGVHPVAPRPRTKNSKASRRLRPSHRPAARFLVGQGPGVPAKERRRPGEAPDRAPAGGRITPGPPGAGTAPAPRRAGGAAPYGRRHGSRIAGSA